MGDTVNSGMYRTAAEIKALWQLLVLRYLYGAAQKLAYTFAGVGGDGDNRYGQRILHRFDVDAAAAAGELVHHVEGNDHRDIQLDELQRKIQAAFDISCVNDVDNCVRLIV